VVIEGGDTSVSVDLQSGAIAISRSGRAVITGATADVLVEGETRPRTLSGPLTHENGRFSTVVRGLELALILEVRDGGEVVAKLTASNESSAPITVLLLAPLVVDARTGGALDLGASLDRVRILENGKAIFFDQTAQVVPGNTERFALADALPIPLRGSSISNWSHAVVDPSTPGSGIVAGFLTAERAVPTLGFSADLWVAEGALVFAGKKLDPLEDVESEVLWLSPHPADAQTALEQYGRALARHNNTTRWPDRDGGRPVPNGWNSWSGGSGSGGHGQTINQAIYDDAAVRLSGAFGEFGLDWLQLDDGWQKQTGDWDWRPALFPGGAEAVVASAHDHALRAGLWIAPFLAVQGSTTAREHPEWLMDRAPGLPGAAAKDKEALDPSNPEVRAHLKALGARIKADGFSWVKLDFAYFSLLGQLKADPSMTQVEAWKAAWRAFREGLGDEIFLLGVGVVGAQIGTVDGMRLTLDDGPRWDEDSPDGLASGGALKSSVRTAARRWFYDKVFVTHPDLLFFRSHPDGPTLTFEEARTFATWVAFTGGIVKIGDTMDDLFADPRNVDVVRKLLPAWPHAARPLDVMTREYPEQFEMWGRPDRVLGLFNWGTNRERGEPIAEGPRTHRVRCAEPCRVYSFWDDAFLGTKMGDFDIEVPPRRVAVLALTKAIDEPQLIGTQRNVAMTDLTRTRFIEPVLEVQIPRGVRGTAEHPWEDELVVWLPPGRAIERVDGVEAPAVTVDGEIARIRFRARTSGSEVSVEIHVR